VKSTASTITSASTLFFSRQRIWPAGPLRFSFCRVHLYFAIALGLLPELAGAQATTPVKPAKTVTYVTQAGDSLYDIASRYLRDPRDWSTVRRLNHVKVARRMPPGIELQLPVALLKREPQSARIVATSGPAEQTFQQNVFTPVTVGMAVGEGDRLRTGRNGFVTLEFEDGSHLSLPQDSMIEIVTLRRTALTGTKDRVIQLWRGEVDSDVKHAKQVADRFQIRSPSVVAGVRGTRFRVSYDNADRSTAVAVLDGAVGVDAANGAVEDVAPPGQPLQASAQLIPAKFGNVTNVGGSVGTPIRLLSPPELVHPGKVQDEKDVVFDLLPFAGAHAYRVQIARDAVLLDLLRDQRVNEPRATFKDVPNGTYFVRVSSIDENGLEGLPRVFAFERRQLGVATSARRLGSREFEFRWLVERSDVATTRFRFVLSSTPDLHDPIIDEPDLTTGEIVVSDLHPGVYYWTVIAEQFENGRFYQKGGAVRSFTLAQ
jgi:hypothetical protein